MSIASAIVNKQQQIADCYTAISNKGGTLPVTQDVANMPTAISSIPTDWKDSGGKYPIYVIDYNGELIRTDHLNTGDVFDLPSPPTHDKLTFEEWSATEPIVNNSITVTDKPVLIGAIYTPTSGYTELDITLTPTTGLEVTCNWSGAKDWGDGTEDNNSTHTYTNYGDYTILCKNPNNVYSNFAMCGQSSSVPNYYLKHARINKKITHLGYYLFTDCMSLEDVSIPSNITYSLAYAFSRCYKLKALIFPKNFTDMGLYTSGFCNSLKWCVFPYGTTNVGAINFQDAYSLQIVVIPDTVTGLTDGLCYSARQVCYFHYPVGITGTLPIIFSDAGKNLLAGTVNIPSGITTIPANAFNNSPNVSEYDFSSLSSVPTLSNINAFNSISPICKILVPTSLETSWKTATNWSTYANYIVGV